MLTTARTESTWWAAAMTAAPPKECPTSSRTSRPDSFMNRTASAVFGDLVGKGPVAPVALGIAEPEIVEAEHPDALAGQLLADPAGGGALLAKGEAVREHAPATDRGYRVVDQTSQLGPARARKPDTLGHVGHPPRPGMGALTGHGTDSKQMSAFCMRLSDGLWHELCDLEHLYPDGMATWLIVLGREQAQVDDRRRCVGGSCGSSAGFLLAWDAWSARRS